LTTMNPIQKFGKWEHFPGHVTYSYILALSIHATAVGTNFNFDA